MSRKILVVLLTLFVVMFAIACSSEGETQKDRKDDMGSENKGNHDSNNDNENKNKESNQEKDWQEALEAPEVPNNKSDVIDQPSGELANLDVRHNDNDKKKAVEYFSDLPKLEEDASEEKMGAYWRKIHEVFHGDYPGTEDILKKLKFGSFGSPDIEDDRFQFKEHLNVEIVLDASGSMAEQMGGKTKMEVAKDTIRDFASSLPDEAKVSLRVYGHKGTGSESDKKMSCNSSKLVYGLEPYDSQKLDNALDQFDPAGWTPTTLVLKKAKKDLSDYPSKNNTNIVYLVGDGVNTCGGNPPKVAKKLADSDVDPIINVIGFGIDKKGKKQLKKIADKADGMYTAADDEDQLKEQLDKAEDIADKWKDWKESAKTESDVKRVDKKFEVLHFYLGWKETYNQETRNIWKTLQVLKEQGDITSEAYSFINGKRKEQNQKIYNISDNMKEKLEDINEENFKKAKEDIEKAYEENTK